MLVGVTEMLQQQKHTTAEKIVVVEVEAVLIILIGLIAQVPVVPE
jgi:hypothetical protein